MNEKGISEFGAEILLRFAARSGKTVEWLLTGKTSSWKERKAVKKTVELFDLGNFERLKCNQHCRVQACARRNRIGGRELG